MERISWKISLNEGDVNETAPQSILSTIDYQHLVKSVSSLEKVDAKYGLQSVQSFKEVRVEEFVRVPRSEID